MSLRALVRLAFVVSTVSICVLRAQDSGWILTNVQIVDLERGSVLDARTLHISDDRIAAIVESPTAVQVAGLDDFRNHDDVLLAAWAALTSRSAAQSLKRRTRSP